MPHIPSGRSIKAQNPWIIFGCGERFKGESISFGFEDRREYQSALDSSIEYLQTPNSVANDTI